MQRLKHFSRVGTYMFVTVLVASFFFWAFLPNAIIKTNLSASAVPVLLVAILTHAIGACVEYGIHAGPFHRPLWPFKTFNRMHLKHHVQYEKELEVLPWFWFGMIYLGALPLLLGAQFLFPKSAVILGGTIGILWSYFLFEVMHYMAHTCPHSRVARYHDKHHKNARCNFSMAGFYGIPIDRLFGTAH